MGSRNKKGEATSQPFSPSHLRLHENFQQERDVWVRGRGHAVLANKSTSPTLFPHVFWKTNLYLAETQTRVWVLVGVCRAEVSLHSFLIIIIN